jgi:hypothetical protein
MAYGKAATFDLRQPERSSITSLGPPEESLAALLLSGPNAAKSDAHLDRLSVTGLAHVEHKDERVVAARCVSHRSRTRKTYPVGAEQDARAQGNQLPDLNVNPSAGDIDAFARRALDLSTFVNPG